MRFATAVPTVVSLEHGVFQLNPVNIRFFQAVFKTVEFLAMKWPTLSIKYPNIFPYRQCLVKLCQMGISDIITNILCPRAMPNECNRSGLHRCYGLSDTKSWCQSCFGQPPPPPPPILQAGPNEPTTSNHSITLLTIL